MLAMKRANTRSHLNYLMANPKTICNRKLNTKLDKMPNHKFAIRSFGSAPQCRKVRLFEEKLPPKAMADTPILQRCLTSSYIVISVISSPILLILRLPHRSTVRDWTAIWPTVNCGGDYDDDYDKGKTLQRPGTRTTAWATVDPTGHLVWP